MIDIIDYRYHILCELENKNLAKHSIGQHNAPMALRTNICHQCLKEIVAEGLKVLTEDERAEVLECYLRDAIKTPEEPEKIEEKEKDETAGIEDKGEDLKEKHSDEGSNVVLEFLDGQIKDDPTADEVPFADNEETEDYDDTKERNMALHEQIAAIREANSKREKFSIENMPRAEIIEKARALGVKGKINTFSNKKLEKEINQKLGGK